VNKGELVAALAERLDGNRSAASAALDGLLDVIVRTVRDGDSVSLAGFGVFERRERAARAGRNPRTGETIELPATVVPAFRAGAYFREVIVGARELSAPPVRPLGYRPPARRAVTRASASVDAIGGDGAASVGVSEPEVTSVNTSTPSQDGALPAETTRSGKGKAGKAAKVGKRKGASVKNGKVASGKAKKKAKK
jgi:DNA-binding protein HU-beta